METFLYKEESYKILGAFFEVNRNLQKGLLETVYEKALMYELKQRGLEPSVQKQLTVTYKGLNIGVYKPDIIVNDKIILELKSTSCIISEHKAQLLNYMAITGCKVGYILNFSGERDHCRLVL